MSYLSRFITAAHDVARFHCEITVRLSQIDWSKCTNAEDDGEGRLVACPRQSVTSSDPATMFDDGPAVCGACEDNRYLLKQIKTARRRRYLAMLRVARLSAHVGEVRS